jgi:iron complex transport system ATP-binding protein
MVMILEINDAGFAYENAAASVFENVRMSVESGKVLCILGPNGVGKTSLLKCIAGLLPLTSGTIRCKGKKLSRLKQNQIAQVMAYVPQIHYPVFSYSVFETVLMGRTPFLGFFSFPEPKDEQVAVSAIEALGITHLSNKAYTQISGGERQLVMFARALAQEPEVIILDEPTFHLDYGNQVKILSLIHQLSRRGTAVIMTSHNPDHAFMIADKVGIMFDRNIQGFECPETAVTEQILHRIYGIRVRLQDDPDFGKICVPALTKCSEPGQMPGSACRL